VEPQLDDRLGEGGVAGEAVNHTRQPRSGLSEYPEGVVVRLAGVDDHRLAQAPGELELRAEDPPLIFPGREVIVVVEAGLPHRHDPFHRRGLGELGEELLGAVLRVVGMKAGGGPDVLVGRGESPGLHVSPGPTPGANGDDAADVRLARPVEHGGEVLGVVVEAEVGVGVEEHDPLPPVRRDHAGTIRRTLQWRKEVEVGCYADRSWDRSEG